jgi:carboxynorspermidine decarboxylase
MLPLADIPSPCYVIDERRLKANLERINRIQTETGAKVILALKAFSTFSTFPLISQYLSGTTASSLNEVRLAHDTFGKEIHVYSPGYKPNEIDEICGYAHHIVFNSLPQLEKYFYYVRDRYPHVEIGLRINPEHSEVNYPIYDPCCTFSRFGVTKTEMDKSNFDFTKLDGVHFHTLCGKHVDSLERTIEVVREKFSDLIHHMKWVNCGGGHGLTYPNYDIDRLCRLIKSVRQEFDVQFIMEPGEGIVFGTGYLVASVVDLLYNDMNLAVIDSSASAHMPDVIEMPYRPEIEGSAQPNEKEYTYRLGGVTCLSGDVIGNYSFDKPLQIGQKLVFKDMAHYTMVKNTFFNGITLPSIGRVDQDGVFHLDRSFCYEDFKSRLGNVNFKLDLV